MQDNYNTTSLLGLTAASFCFWLGCPFALYFSLTSMEARGWRSLKIINWITSSLHAVLVTIGKQTEDAIDSNFFSNLITPAMSNCFFLFLFESWGMKQVLNLALYFSWVDNHCQHSPKPH